MLITTTMIRTIATRMIAVYSKAPAVGQKNEKEATQTQTQANDGIALHYQPQQSTTVLATTINRQVTMALLSRQHLGNLHACESEIYVA
jgi:hypothetical protein